MTESTLSRYLLVLLIIDDEQYLADCCGAFLLDHDGSHVVVIVVVVVLVTIHHLWIDQALLTVLIEYYCHSVTENQFYLRTSLPDLHTVGDLSV